MGRDLGRLGYNLRMLIPEAIGNRLRVALAAALSSHGVEVLPHDVKLEYPLDISNGDYATGAAMRYAKQVGIAPTELAQKIAETLGVIEGVEKIEIAGPGFINFTLSAKEIGKCVGYAATEQWGRNLSTNQKILFEFTDPNPFKEFHIGHLMSNAIGESLTRLSEFAGYEVRRANYQGDVGLHVAKSIWGKMQKPELSWGEAYAYGSKNYDDNKAAIDEINKKVYTREDAAINEYYKDGLISSQAGFEKIYERVGMEKKRDHHGTEEFFDYYFYESLCWWIGKSIVDDNTPAVFTESDGAIVFKGEEVDPTLHTRVFITSQKLPTYEAKELGLFKSKKDIFGWSPDISVTVTASEQKDYFRVVRAAAERIEELSEIAKKTKHITHGMMRLPTGKMSSRTGDVITGESLLDELTEAANDRAAESRADDKQKLANDVAVAAIKFQILKQASGKDIIFDRERALSLEGDSGPYLQYAHARAHQIVEKGKVEGVNAQIDSTAAPHLVTRLIHRFPEIVEHASVLMEPHIVTTYLTELASAYNSWYAQEQILDGTPATAHKVAVVDAVRNTLKNGLWILGIPAPEKM